MCGSFGLECLFINLTDERYTKFIKPHLLGSTLLFTLAGVNNPGSPVSGSVKVVLIDEARKNVSEQIQHVKLQSFLRTDIPVSMTLPLKPGGYMLVAEFTPENGNPVISRRFLKIGQAASYSFYQLDPKQ